MSRPYSQRLKPMPKKGTHAYREHRRRIVAASIYRHKYGWTLAEVEAFRAQCGNRCQICGQRGTRKAPLHLDHCHATGVKRGMLCYRCNVGIGMFRDSDQLLLAAVCYLRLERK